MAGIDSQRERNGIEREGFSEEEWREREEEIEEEGGDKERNQMYFITLKVRPSQMSFVFMSL